MNTNRCKGMLVFGRAIAYFTSKGIPVMIPLNDTQRYDLVIDEDGALKKVSVKTSMYKTKYGSYEVLLKNCGGASGKFKTRYFENTSCDYLFILTEDSTMYLIPSDVITSKSTITVGKMLYNEYKVCF